MSAIRSTPAKSVDAYLKLVPEAMRVALQKLRKIIKAAAPETTVVGARSVSSLASLSPPRL
ncbi:MAG TPA: hypothetical protein VF910_04285 [Candidatus Bathyarchaeia archaeon]